MVNTDEAEICDECGEKQMKVIGDINSTRLFICLECFAEKHEFIGFDSCEHEYNDRAGNKCIHCGEPSINYA
jgi:hypothetical protein